ncbi:MAG: sulfite reductase subunit alpha [Verrucomicrobia bacterium Tous-C9LFEB]|nr:MAG: sulfite reductase subunit alpha [Verrucomicrobia bacterium Tous-C9LFEB]
MLTAPPTIPENAPFTTEQKAWINGYLAGLYACSRNSTINSAQLPEAPREPLHILFGSQTGTAEGLAHRLSKLAKSKGFGAQVKPLGEGAALDWSAVKNLLVITSTYGDGDMPDNAQSGWEFLASDQAPMLAQTRFSVLALGDTNYSAFCQAGKKFDARLEELGAQRVTPRVDCDVDYEKAALEWFESVMAGLGSHTTTVSVANSELDVAVATDYSKTNPFPAKLLTSRVLNGAGSSKETRHVEISLEGSGLSYQVGDALGVMPSNCPALVDELIRALHCDGEEAVPLPSGGETSLRAALQNHYDITKVSNELARDFFDRSGEVSYKQLLSPAHEEEFKKYLYSRDVIDMLVEFPQVRHTAAELCALLKKLAPRLYSISSSPLAHPGQVHLTVGVVRYEIKGRSKGGVCSTFLADRIGVGGTVPVYVQASHGFRLPVDDQVPVIMVGPGTGIAPFRAFLEERQARGAKGRNWLFFGDQRESSDYLYRDALEEWKKEGHLTRLSTAFSRDQEKKIYVQHRMEEEVAELWSWLQEGACFYVCGDASRMAKDVDQALHRVAEAGGGLTAEAAADYIKKLRTEKRYLRDVY